MLHVNLSIESLKQPHKCKQALLLTPNHHDVVDAHKSDGKYVDDDDADDEENEEQVRIRRRCGRRRRTVG